MIPIKPNPMPDEIIEKLGLRWHINDAMKMKPGWQCYKTKMPGVFIANYDVYSRGELNEDTWMVFRMVGVTLQWFTVHVNALENCTNTNVFEKAFALVVVEHKEKDARSKLHMPTSLRSQCSNDVPVAVPTYSFPDIKRMVGDLDLVGLDTLIDVVLVEEKERYYAKEKNAIADLIQSRINDIRNEINSTPW